MASLLSIMALVQLCDLMVAEEKGPSGPHCCRVADASGPSQLWGTLRLHAGVPVLCGLWLGGPSTLCLLCPSPRPLPALPLNTLVTSLPVSCVEAGSWLSSPSSPPSGCVAWPPCRFLPRPRRRGTAPQPPLSSPFSSRALGPRGRAGCTGHCSLRA